MRLYVKLVVIVVVAYAVQVALASSWATDTCFGLRCLAASNMCDADAEARLVRECQAKLAVECCKPAPVTVVALHDAPLPW